ncbi:DNA methyltransferase [Meiothermus cerbereus]|uniref:DNA methyltransferase n=1 Tax=Meiothermus cerbereus TaxID=65552 RepID=UPI00048721D9|nr:DNA methyltransferase [Meiothermus cerbereus]
MSNPRDRFLDLLKELFQFDLTDLDFGIYRIMNAKREEIVRFLDRDLLPQVREAFQDYEAENRAGVEAELEEAIAKAKELGADPETLPRIKELRAKLTQAVDVTALENEVYSHLYNFFRRYYSEGDFISRRRYKEGVYAIPYEGEEVKLYWANHDQYYIKTSEYLRNYTFKLPSGRRVHFKLVEADTEKDNNRALNGNERRFILSPDQPLAEENGELVIRFVFRPDPEKRKQADLNAAAVDRILKQTTGFDDWRQELASLRPTEKNANRTLLEKHLTDYTARNTFDYFIHKDLGGFLRRELDFYIKNEVMHLDDVESETAPRVEQYLSKIKAIRRIAHKIIDFLAQIENFQKKLWLKKKFVVDTQYCITMGRILRIKDEETRHWLIGEIIKNDAQREEWVRLFAINEIEGNLTTPGYTEPLTPEFLKAHPTLVVDTRHFDEAFKLRLLAAIPDLDEETDGLLIHSENFQALNLMLERYRASVNAIYIDPPYNSPASEIPYKNDYKHSSWLALMHDRLLRSVAYLVDDAPYAIAIDDYEQAVLCTLLDALFPQMDRQMVIVNHHPQGGMSHNISRTHEYMAILVPSGLDVLRGREKTSGVEYRSFMLSGPGTNKTRAGRPNSFYAVLVDRKARKVVGVEPPPKAAKYPTDPTKDGYERIYPINQAGEEKVWCRTFESARSLVAQGAIVLTDQGTLKIAIDTTGRRRSLMSNWTDSRYNAGPHGTALIADILGVRDLFAYPKSLFTVMDAIEAMTWFAEEPNILDYFAGSGTTGHAVINLNREDGGRRKFILVEMGDYFDTVLVPRIKKVIFTPEWKDGKPKRMATPEEAERSPRILKILRLESYEDTLNNLELKRTEAQQTLLEQHPEFREDYMLRYMLDVESRGSASLLNIDRFEDPFNYKLEIATGTAGETKPTVVDLVETFNYLLGLRVKKKKMDDVRGVRVVTGTNPQGERVLILWRNTKELGNDALDAWFRRQGYNTKDQEFDVIYVNGDNNLENLRKPDQTWKVRLIEEEFQRLMFDVADV